MSMATASMPANCFLREGLIVGVQAGLLAVVRDVFHGGPVQVADQRDVAMPLGHRLLVHAQVGDDARFLARWPAPTARSMMFQASSQLMRSSASAPQDVGLEQHIDGMALKGDGEPRAGQRPGDPDPPDAMHGASDPWEVRMEPGRQPP